jgi:hypothetical protein
MPLYRVVVETKTTQVSEFPIEVPDGTTKEEVEKIFMERCKLGGLIGRYDEPLIEEKIRKINPV